MAKKAVGDLYEEVVNCRKLLLEVRMIGNAPVRDMIDKAFVGEKLYEFDDLEDEASEHAIEAYMKSPTIYEVVIDDLRHMKFDEEGHLMRGYDEE